MDKNRKKQLIADTPSQPRRPGWKIRRLIDLHVDLDLAVALARTYLLMRCCTARRTAVQTGNTSVLVLIPVFLAGAQPRGLLHQSSSQSSQIEWSVDGR